MSTSIAIIGKGIERSIRPTSVLDPRRDSDIVVIVVRRAMIGVAAWISRWCWLAMYGGSHGLLELKNINQST